MPKKIRIGYACTPISIPYKTSRSFLLKNFNEEILNECVSSNLRDLMNILKWNSQNDIPMFRISSDIIPFGSHPVNNIKWWEIFKQELADCGAFVKANGIRVSMHPGQYTVLNSADEIVRDKSIADLEYHCRFLDALGVDNSNKIILHVGGVYGNKPPAIQRFESNFKLLSASVKKRLVIENDDKSYTIEDVLGISKSLGIPAVFDNLHHKFNPCTLQWDEILYAVRESWKSEDGPVKFHYSDQDLVKKGGAHSRSINTKNFFDYLDSLKVLDVDVDADIMLEVKDKEISALKCVCALDDNLVVSKRTEQWAKYKYSVMEKNYSYYKKCSSLIKSDAPMKEIYIYIDECLDDPFEAGNFINTAQHVFGYIKDKVTAKEKETFMELLKNPDENKVRVKNLLQKLCKKYKIQYINSSYYFIY